MILTTAASKQTQVDVVPPIETWVDKHDSEFHLTIPPPGLRPEDIQLNLQGSRLTLSGQHEHEDVGKDYIERELTYKHFVRSVVLPDGIAAEKLIAVLQDGILEVIAPIGPTTLPRLIPVTARHDGQASQGK